MIRIMETRNENTVIAFVSTHPGEILRAWLEDVDIKQKDFAITIGMPASRLNELIKGKRSMTEDIAQKLERALGVEASFWMRAQANYEYNERMLALRNDEQKKQMLKKIRFDRFSTSKSYTNILASPPHLPYSERKNYSPNSALHTKI